MTNGTVVRAEELDWFLVKLTHPNHQKKIVFRSVSKNRAEAFLANRYPRGSEAYLEYPDGSTYHYERERQGDLGKDADYWAPFDPNSWIPPDSQVPPGENAWSDKEG